MPFIELLSQLMGNAEARLAEGRITSTNTEKLKGIMKTSAKVLITEAPGILSTFLPGSSALVYADALIDIRTITIF